MTDEMIALAHRNANERDVANVRFLRGEIEHIPLPEASADVVISNCVINLSADKLQVLVEHSASSSRAVDSPSRMSWSRAACRR
jgi:arsenite methyltransferase